MRLSLKLVLIFIMHLLCVSGLLRFAKSGMDLLLLGTVGCLVPSVLYYSAMTYARPGFPIAPRLLASFGLSIASCAAGFVWYTISIFGLP
jgi:hypothetical protein